MRNFGAAKRIRIIEPEHGMNGQAGTIYRHRICDNGAWVAMDNEPSEHLCSFPKSDHRRNHIILYPDQCEEVIP